MDFYHMMLTPLMAIEILIGEFLFCYHREKEDYYWIRVIALSIVTIGIVIWVELFYGFLTGGYFAYGGTGDANSSVFKFFYYLFTFVLTLVVIRSSYKGSWWSILYYCSAGFASQHLAIGIASLFNLLPFMQDLIKNYEWISTIVEVFFLILVYVVIFFLLIKKEKGSLETKKNIRRKVVISLVVLFFCIGLSRITTDNPNRNFYPLSQILFIPFCVVVLS